MAHSRSRTEAHGDGGLCCVKPVLLLHLLYIHTSAIFTNFRSVSETIFCFSYL